MNSLSFATLFLPDWALPWMVVLAIAAWILRARALAGLAALIVLADVVIGPLVAPWLDAIPLWALLPLLPIIGLLLLHGLIVAAFGPETAGQVTGTYLVRLLDLIFLGPFRLIRFLLRL